MPMSEQANVAVKEEEGDEYIVPADDVVKEEEGEYVQMDGTRIRLAPLRQLAQGPIIDDKGTGLVQVQPLTPRRLRDTEEEMGWLVERDSGPAEQHHRIICD